jgi:DNA-binding NarL/FixJ family response regulator
MNGTNTGGGSAQRVLVVDDHPMWRDAVARDLADAGYEVATASDGRQALRIAAAVRPHIVVLDLQLPDLSGVNVIQGMLGTIDTHILVLSASGERQDVLDAVKAGATGYLIKSASREEFLEAVSRTRSGAPVFTARLAGLVLGEFRRLAALPDHTQDTTPRPPGLTERETEILRLVAKGVSYRQIA